MGKNILKDHLKRWIWRNCKFILLALFLITLSVLTYESVTIKESDKIYLIIINTLISLNVGIITGLILEMFNDKREAEKWYRHLPGLFGDLKRYIKLLEDKKDAVWFAQEVAMLSAEYYSCRINKRYIYVPKGVKAIIKPYEKVIEDNLSNGKVNGKVDEDFKDKIQNLREELTEYLDRKLS